MTNAFMPRLPSVPRSRHPTVRSWSLTHVDVIPTQIEPGTAKVKAFVEEGRNAPGNLRFDDVVQANRKNHFTVIEAWKSQADKNAWISGKTARTFREELQPIGGALYDERVFRVLY